MMKKVAAIHLLNDYSGSPLILSTVIKGFRKKNVAINLYTSAKGEGFLSNLDVDYKAVSYTFFDNKILRLFAYIFSQIHLFFQLLSLKNQEVIIYVNTLLPFGAALAGKIMGKKVIYHIHEISVKPIVLKKFLMFVAKKTASEIIFVSHFLAQSAAISSVPTKVVHNALSNDFIEKANIYKAERDAKTKINKLFTALMLCSLKDYKGVKVFVELAKQLPQMAFQLVLNAAQNDINDYFKDIQTPDNLALYPTQSNVHPFYQNADVVLNLSHPKQWIETFGMTLLEAMYYDLPVIAPPVGGPIEVVQHGENGFCIDQRNVSEIVDVLTQMASDTALYNCLSEYAFETAKNFNVGRMQQDVLDCL